jgi:hypothetical protein
VSNWESWFLWIVIVYTVSIALGRLGVLDGDAGAFERRDTTKRTRSPIAPGSVRLPGGG